MVLYKESSKRWHVMTVILYKNETNISGNTNSMLIKKTNISKIHNCLPGPHQKDDER